MADTLSFRKADGSTTTVANNTTITLDHTVPSIDLAVLVDQPGLDQGEVRGWISESPTKEGPFVSGQYGLTIFLEQGQSKSVLIKTVQAHTLANLSNSIFEKVVDTFTITVSRNNAPADSVTDSVSVNFLVYPDSEASLAIVNASFELLDSSGFDIVDSPYVRERQNRNFDFLINLPKSIDSVGITRSLFDSDVRKSTSVTDVGGDGSLTYNNSTGIITYTGPSASEVRSHFSAGGDLSYDSSTGIFQFDVEQVYTRANFDSDFNMAIADYFLDGDGLKFDSATNELQIDSAELSSYFRQDIRSYISGTDAGGDGSFSYNAATGVITYTGPSAAEVRAHLTANKGLIYNSSTGNFDVDSANLRTIISANDAGGDGSFSYNNTTGVFTYTGPSASEVRSHFSAGGDLSYDSSTGVFQFDVEQVYTKENFDSDFNLTLDSAVLEGFGLKYDNNTNTLSIDSAELSSYFRQDIRSYISADKGLVYNSTTGNFDVDSANLRTIISAVDAGGDGSFSYNSSTGVFTYTGPSAAEVRAHLSADKGLVYNASTGNFDVDSANLRTIISATDAGGDGSFAYNNSTGVFTYTGPSATEVRNHFTGGTGIAISSGDIKIDSSELTSLYRQTIRTYLNVVDAGGDGSFAYDSTLGKFTYTGPSASEVRAHLTANKGLSVSSGEFNIDSANVRGMFSGGTGVTYTAGSGVIAIGQPVATTDSVTFAGMTVSGNLQVTGTTTTVNSTTLDVADKNITIAKGAANAAAADGGGITVDGAGATLTYAATGDKFVFNKPFEGSFLGSDSDFDARLATKTTTNLTEGNNLYYTTARADSDAKAALFAIDAGGDGSFTYDSSSGVMTYTGPSSSEVRAHLSATDAGGDGSFSYNNSTGVFTYTGPSATEVRAHFTGGAGIGLASGDIKIDSSELYSLYKHDDFADFVADEHIAHSGVSIIAGLGLIGGGDITASRTLNVIGGKGIIANANDIQIDSTNVKGMLSATDAGGDGSFAYNNSTGVFTYTGPSSSEVRAHFTGGTGITYNSGTGEFTTTDADIVHDNLSGFVANEHIDHTTVSIIAGKGLTGGGTIAADRTINIDSANVKEMLSATDAGGDGSFEYNNSTGVFTYTGPSAAQVRAHFTGDKGLVYNSTTGNFDIDSSNVKGMFSGGTGITYNSSTGAITTTDGEIVHDNLSGFVADEHIAHSGVSIIAGKGLIGGGTIASSRTLDIDSANVRSMFSAGGDLSYNSGTGQFSFDVEQVYTKANFDSDFNVAIDSATTSDLSEGTNLYYTDARFDTRLATKTTANLAEGSNLYYTNARADARVNLQTGANLDLSQKSTSDLSEGTNKYYTKARVDSDFDASFALASTDSLSEGSTNLYFTNERVDDRVGALITGGVNVTATYDDAAGTLEIKVPFENIDDRVGAILTGGSGIDVNYDDPNATVTITNTLNTSDFPDSAFVTSRPISTFTNDALYLDSTTVQGVISSDYIQSNQIQYNTSNFTDSTFVTGLPISTFTNDANYLDSTYAAALIDSAHIKAVVDSAYVQLIQADLQRDSGFISSVITGGTLNMGANNIITTGKILFANLYSQLSDLPSASTYHGMFAHVHGTGKAYYSHAGAWIELANNSQLSNSGNWDTAFGWGNHADAGYQSAATALDSAMVYRFTIDSTRTIALIDEAYIQDRQTKYNTSDFTDSAFVTGLPISTFTNDANYLDSTTITGVVNNAYVRARQALIDSDLTKLLVDSAYIQLRDRFQDSSLVTSTVDSSYVQLRVPETYLSTIIDSSYVTARAGVVLDSASIASGVILTTVDDAYVRARQIQYNTTDFTDSAFVTGLPVSTFTNDVKYLDSTTVQGVISSDYIQSKQNDYLDSALTTQLIDSAYIALRTTAGTDSATVISLIDSDYVGARVSGVVAPQFTDFRYKADSGQTLFSGADLGGASLNLRADNFNVYLNGIKLIDSDFTASVANNTITLTEGADSDDDIVITTIEGDIVDATNVVDSAYVQARQEGVNATFKDFKFVATSNQTVFSGNDANGDALSFETNKFHVLLNGIRLDASDFTESADNNKITLAAGATVSDELIVSTIGTEKTTTLASITGTVDSAYVQLRADSDYIRTAVDSDYIKTAVDSDYIKTAVDSAYLLNTGFTVEKANQVFVDESEDDDVYYNLIFENTNPSGNGYSQMQVDGGVLSFNPGTNNLFNLGPITSRSFNQNVGGLIQIQNRDGSINVGQKLGSIEWNAPFEGSGSDAVAVAAAITAEADAAFSSTNNSTDLVFKLGTSGTATEKARLTHEGQFGIGTSTPVDMLEISRTSTDQTVGLTLTNQQSGGYGSGIVWKSKRTDTGTLLPAAEITVSGENSWNGEANVASMMEFHTQKDGTLTRHMSLSKNGILMIGHNNYTPNSHTGVYLNGGSGKGFFTVDGDAPLAIHRLSSDGDLVELRQDNNTEGTISVSGSTVSYNGFSGQHETSGIATNTEIGTVVSTIDELDTYFSGDKKGQTRADHAKVKVSDSAGDNCVYGVVSRFDSDGKAFVASVGIGSIRVTGACAKGDLLESNGDGTAKVQSDDIIRSKTIGKVTIGNSNSGVKLVSCVLYCG